MNGIFDELRIAAHSVWQRRWLALAIAWGVCMLGWLVVAFFPNSYESKARISVQMQNVLDKGLGIDTADRRRQIDQVQQTLTSQVNLEKVVRSTKMGERITNPRELEGKVAALRKDIKVVSQQDNLFEITAVASQSSLSDAQNAQLVQEIVQKLIDIFREENLSGDRGELSETLAFMDRQLAERQRALEAAEQQRVAFEARNTGLMPGLGSASQRLETARAEVRGIESDLITAQSALAAINGQLAGTPQTISNGGFSGGGNGVGGARSALADAQGQLAALRSRGLTDSHPDIIALKSQIASLRELAQQEASASRSGGGPNSSPNPAYSSLLSIRSERQANVQGLMARKASLQREMATMTGQLSSQPGVAAEMERINRDYDVLKQQYDELLRNREDLRLRSQVDSETSAVKITVIDRPSVPRTPVAPNRPLLLALVLLAGIGAGIGAAFAMSQLSSSFPTTDKLERATGLPVIGAISHTLTHTQRTLRAKQLKWFFAGAAGLFAVFTLLMGFEFLQRGMIA